MDFRFYKVETLEGIKNIQGVNPSILVALKLYNEQVPMHLSRSLYDFVSYLEGKEVVDKTFKEYSNKIVNLLNKKYNEYSNEDWGELLTIERIKELIEDRIDTWDACYK